MADGVDADRLLTLYNTPDVPGAFRGYRGLQTIAKDNGMGTLSVESARRILEGDRSYTSHGRVVKGAKNLTERIVTAWPFDLWEADLMDPPRAREADRERHNAGRRGGPVRRGDKYICPACAEMYRFWPVQTPLLQLLSSETPPPSPHPINRVSGYKAVMKLPIWHNGKTSVRKSSV